ncbi:hypothetical protein [Escherichia phage vB_EcoM_APEC]|nr:hypothetical protein [Escherichia phage vB_EcoM_APEC]
MFKKLQIQLNDAIRKQDELAVKLAEAQDDFLIAKLDELYKSASEWVDLLQRQVNREQRRAAK